MEGRREEAGSGAGSQKAGGEQKERRGVGRVSLAAGGEEKDITSRKPKDGKRRRRGESRT